MKLTKLRKNINGFIMPAVLSFIIVIMILAGALAEIVDANLSTVSNNIKSLQAFNIAEAGINYYLWHMSHNGADYKDGKTTPTVPDPTLGYGPYVHNYINDNAVNEGTFTLWIKPKGNGSTIVTVRSIGQVKGDLNIRTVEAQIGATSFASYGLVSDTAFWFGNNENASGPVHSNQGVRMDGANSDVVSSANATYTPTFGAGGCAASNCSHPGVWCDPSVVSPINCNTRNKSDWLFPKPTVDFNQVSSSLCNLKKIAFAADPATSAYNNCSQIPSPSVRTSSYIPQRNSTYNKFNGYLIQLNNNGTYNLSTVNNENDTKPYPYASAMTLATVANNIAIPSTGVIFVEDNVWIRSNPTFHGRVTIGAGRLATAANAEIIISDNLAYSTKDGSDAIGLVSEDSVEIAPYAPPWPGASGFNFEVDAAVIAPTGSVSYLSNYRNNNACTRGWVNNNQTFTYYGSVASRQSWTWNWQNNSHCGDNVFDPSQGFYVHGVEHTDTQYDYNLLYAPPPSYPVTGGYQIMSWREVLTHP